MASPPALGQRVGGGRPGARGLAAGCRPRLGPLGSLQPSCPSSLPHGPRAAGRSGPAHLPSDGPARLPPARNKGGGRAAAAPAPAPPPGPGRVPASPPPPHARARRRRAHSPPGRPPGRGPGRGGRRELRPGCHSAIPAVSPAARARGPSGGSARTRGGRGRVRPRAEGVGRRGAERADVTRRCARGRAAPTLVPRLPAAPRVPPAPRSRVHSASCGLRATSGGGGGHRPGLRF